MKKIAIIYASHDGHTLKICQTIAEQLAEQTHTQTDLLDVEQCDAETIENYSVLVFGSAIRYGKHLKPMVSYLQNHREALTNKQTAFFSVNLTARKENRNTPETSHYVKKLLAQLDWQPDVVDVFAGKLNYPQYGFFDKQIIRFIMWLTKGETDPNAVVEYTDWARVKQLSQRLKQL